MNDRLYAIPGATGSLGPPVARRLLDAGARVALAGRDEGSLVALASELNGGERVLIRAVDLLDPAATNAWAQSLGPVDGVVQLVGGWRGGVPLATAPLEDWAFLEATLVRSTQHVTQAFHPTLSASAHGGRFVLVSAKGAAEPTDANAAYAAAKAAAEAWTWALADGFAKTKSGATANVVAVNALVTPAMRAASPEKEFRSFADVGDVAEAIAFLLSDAAAKMNGQRVALYR